MILFLTILGSGAAIPPAGDTAAAVTINGQAVTINGQAATINTSA